MIGSVSTMVSQCRDKEAYLKAAYSQEEGSAADFVLMKNFNLNFI